MICPSCGHVNVPGADECSQCLFPLASVDANPTGQDAVEESVLHDLVRKLKPKPMVTIPEDGTLGLALDRMVEHGVGALLVVDKNDKLAGILTERDYLKKVIGLIDDYARLPLRDHMTRDPETVTPDDPLGLAVQKMDVGGYRHLPVVEDGKPVGIISVRDVIRHLTRLCNT
ncbi:CBS domain-containing protein [Zavarzinella formosa]|uniref:CBS domain-containing protein n=1 Tax=Zavarzinella formosa TaxID=360055 RepID=UPI000366B274|nr:CBS domain-containing protein [Zavarzinella formosa]